MISKNLIRTTIEQSEKEILDFRDLINDQANLSIFFMKLWQIKDLYPKFTQYNPFTQKILLLQELKNLAGIYCWYNITRDLFYIGSSNNLRQRMTCYLSLAYLTSHQDYSIINRALLKYGFSSFVLLILETLEQGKKEQLLELEQLVLDTFIPEYNIQPNASSSAGRILSEEHKAKIAASRKKIIISEETIVKMSVSHMGERNGRFNKGRPVYLYEVTLTEPELIATFPNRARASTILGIPASTLFNYIKSKKHFKANGITVFFLTMEI